MYIYALYALLNTTCPPRHHHNCLMAFMATMYQTVPNHTISMYQTVYGCAQVHHLIICHKTIMVMTGRHVVLR